MPKKTDNTPEEQFIEDSFEKIAHEYGEQFIAERIGHYMIQFLTKPVSPIDIAFTLHFIRFSLLSFFNRPGHFFEINQIIEELADDTCRTVGGMRNDLLELIKVSIKDLGLDDVGLNRKDINFLLDVSLIFEREYDRLSTLPPHVFVDAE